MIILTNFNLKFQIIYLLHVNRNSGKIKLKTRSNYFNVTKKLTD